MGKKKKKKSQKRKLKKQVRNQVKKEEENLLKKIKRNSIDDLKEYTMLSGKTIRYKDRDSLNDVRRVLNNLFKEMAEKKKPLETPDIYYKLRTFKNKFKNFCEVVDV